MLFGFRFPENFDYPYVSLSISEFWRRWHITLNRWFVDYLYIPLGGSRQGTRITVRNRLIVFLATGLWHGAGWTYILWGLWHGLLISLETLFPALAPRGKKPRFPLLRGALTFVLVLIGFVMFRAAGVGQGLRIIGSLFSFAAPDAAALAAVQPLLSPARLFFLALGILFAFPVLPKAKALLAARLGEGSAALELLGDALALVGLVLAVLAMAGGAYTPFIYQQF